MQLHEVERREAEILARAVDPGAVVGRRVVLVQQGDAPAHLRRDERTRIAELRDDPPDDPLAASIAVDVRGVDEGDALGERGLERRGPVGLGHVPQSAPSCQAPKPTHETVRPSRSIVRCSTAPA